MKNSAVPLEDFHSHGTSVALGFFDGVHPGHRAILESAGHYAAGLAPCCFTFSNHPSLLLHPGGSLRLITDFSERCHLIAESGLTCVYADFSEAFSHLSPEDFARVVLVEKLKARHVSCGPNYNFGYKASGTAEKLKSIGKRLGFDVHISDYCRDHGRIISSTLIRNFIAEGDFESVSRILGRPYRICGEVRHGLARGRTIGLPTANILIPAEKMTPPYGVYAVWANIGDGFVPSLAYYGSRPTFSGLEPWLEVNVGACSEAGCELGFSLYGKKLEILFCMQVRGEMRFSSADELTAQIARDKQMACRFFAAASL